MPGQEDEKIDDVHWIDRRRHDLAEKKGATARNEKSPGSREESMPDPSKGPQEDVTLGTGPYDPLDRDEWEAAHPAPPKKEMEERRRT